MVPPASHWIPRVPWYSRTHRRQTASFPYRALTPFGRPFQGRSGQNRFFATAAAESHLAAGAAVNPAAATRDWYRTAVGLGSSPFARHYLGNLG